MQVKPRLRRLLCYWPRSLNLQVNSKLGSCYVIGHGPNGSAGQAKARKVVMLVVKDGNE
jgi:hypothetical protein